MKTCFAVAALLAFSTFPQLVLAEGGLIMSGNGRYPGCKDFIAENPRGSFDAGVCAGLLDGILYWRSLHGICPPPGVTNGQGVRVVVAYMDRNPALLDEAFSDLAVHALRRAWPCR